MTVSYSLDASSSHFGGGVFRIMSRWKGSIYKLVIKELCAFVCAYYFLVVVNKYVLNQTQKKIFTEVFGYMNAFMTSTQIQYILGFFVTMILSRWWMIFYDLPWIDPVGVTLCTYLQGANQRARMYRRTLVRYANASIVLCLRCVSPLVKKRFPTLQHVVEGQLLTQEELLFLEAHRTTSYGEYHQPLFWFGTIVARAREDNYIVNEDHYQHLVDTAQSLRSKLGKLMLYNFVTIPLAYTQVVLIVVYAFLLTSLFGGVSDTARPDYRFFEFFPIFTFLKFVFYLGWLKVGEIMLNPLGEDDDDFELNFLIDRNIAVGFHIVDSHGHCPVPDVDPFWDEREPTIPYTEAAADTYVSPFLGSAIDLKVPEEQTTWAQEVSPDNNTSHIDLRRKLTVVDDFLHNRHSAEDTIERVRKHNNTEHEIIV